MPFYYRTKTGIPGLYYYSGGSRKSSTNAATAAFVFFSFLITAIIVSGWLMYVTFKYLYIGGKWIVLKGVDIYKKKKGIENTPNSEKGLFIQNEHNNTEL